jgi:hypothetical protein
VETLDCWFLDIEPIPSSYKEPLYPGWKKSNFLCALGYIWGKKWAQYVISPMSSNVEVSKSQN